MRAAAFGLIVVALVVLVAQAHGGPGWGATSANAVAAVELEHSMSAPLYDLLAGVAVLVPAGEPGFRLGLLGALLGATTIAGVIAAGRALLPREPAAGLVAALLLLLAPPFREACTSASPSILAAAGASWATAFALARPPSVRMQLAALAACVAIVGSAPWLGIATAIAIALHAKLPRRTLAIAAGAVIVASAVMRIGAVGDLPGVLPSLEGALAASGHGAGAVVVGAGLLGIGFGAVTGLPGARLVAALAALAVAHEIVIGGSAAVVLIILALGGAILAGAIVRMASTSLEGSRRELAVLGAGVPLLVASLATGIASAPAPGTEPIELAVALEGELPPGPGLFLATRPTSYVALVYEHVVSGMRPDLALALSHDDVLAVANLRAHRIVGADAAAFGRLEVRWARPRGRGFQLLGAAPEPTSDVAPPARFVSAIGNQEALELAIERASYEAESGRLDVAARAAGLAERFGAGNLAVLGATVVTKERPPTFAFLPAARSGPWLLDTFGDDLAWVAGIAVPPIAADAPMPRRLHEKWCDVLAGRAKPDDPAIVAMGPVAVDATTTMLKALRP